MIRIEPQFSFRTQTTVLSPLPVVTPRTSDFSHDWVSEESIWLTFWLMCSLNVSPFVPVSLRSTRHQRGGQETGKRQILLSTQSSLGSYRQSHKRHRILCLGPISTRPLIWQVNKFKYRFVPSYRRRSNPTSIPQSSLDAFWVFLTRVLHVLEAILYNYILSSFREFDIKGC